MSKKERLFSVTRKDCEWSYFNGTGNGGQAKNKTRSAVRLYHPPSGVHVQAQESRSKLDNEQLAWKRLGNHPDFVKWARLEAARVTGKLAEIEEKIERDMAREQDFTVEVFRNGKWHKWSEEDDKCESDSE